MCKSKFKPVMLAAFALLVAAPVAGADPARIVSQNAEASQSVQRIWPDSNAQTAPAVSEASALPARWPDAGPAYSTESVSTYGPADVWAANALRDSSVVRPDPEKIAGLRMKAAAEHYGVTTADYGVNTTDYSRPNFAKPSPALVAGLRMKAAAEHYGVDPVNAAPKSLELSVTSDASGAPGAPGALARASAGHVGSPSVSDLRSPDASDAAAAASPQSPVVSDLRSPDASDAAAAASPQSPVVSDLRSPDARDAAQPRVTPSKAGVAQPNNDGQPVLSAPDSEFPWAGLLVGLGLAAMAGMLALVVVRGSRTRPLGR